MIAATNPLRTRDLAQIHCARRDLALTDDTYRALLHRIAGVESAADLDIGGRGRVLNEFRRLGWAPRPKSRKKSTPPPRCRDQRALALALWIELHRLGAVRDPSDLAFAAYAQRQCGVDHWMWARGGKRIDALVGGLRAWHARVELLGLWREAHGYGLAIAGDGSEAALARYLGRPSFGAIRASDATLAHRSGPTAAGQLLAAVVPHRPTVPEPKAAPCA